MKRLSFLKKVKIPSLHELVGKLSGRKNVAGVVESPKIEVIVQELLMVLEAHDENTYHHSRRVANYSVHMAKRLGITGDELCSLYYGALLHDIGKLDVPQEILKNRRTLWQRLKGEEAKLTDEQIEIIRKHSTKGYERLIKLGVKDKIAEISLYHHKNQEEGYPSDDVLAWFDKEDYPSVPALKALAGEEEEEEEYMLPLAEVVSVADTFDAITGLRNYQKQRPKEDALEILRDGIGTEYDGRCVAALEDVIDKNEDIIETLHLYSLTEPLEFFSQS